MSKKKLTKRILLALAAGMIGLAPNASALPNQGSHDNSASASIAIAGNIMNITGKGANNIINWATFSIGKGETVNFTDKNNYLNLVNGVDTSRIYGTISGGNYVYLINPYGILFGEGARLDNVGSFIASTRDISDINQANFLNDPSKVQNVLYSNEHKSRNKDYYPDSSPFVPTISVADIQLTNVPTSATQIILDSPGGVILKNTDVLDKVTRVQTEKYGGEIGIGANEFYAPVTLTEEQKKKLYVFHEKEVEANPEQVITPYQWIHDVNELQAIDQHIKNHPGAYINYMLTNDIDASEENFKTIGGNAEIPTDNNTYRGTFDGMGYEILTPSGLEFETPQQGLFSSIAGTIRNTGLTVTTISYVIEENKYPAVGGISGFFSGSMSNVYVKSPLYLTYNIGGGKCTGGLVGILYRENINDPLSEIRNSSCDYMNVGGGTSVGGIVGKIEAGSFFNVSAYNKVLATRNGIAGGIVGETASLADANQRILSAYVGGYVDADHDWRYGIQTNGEYSSVGGIIGYHGALFPIGDTYNKSHISGYGAGGIIGNIPNNNVHNLVYTSKASAKALDSYYDSTSINTDGGDDSRPDYGGVWRPDNNHIGSGASFGVPLSYAELNDAFNKSIFGTNTSGIPYMIPTKSPASTSSLPTNTNNNNPSGSNTGNNTGGNGSGTNPQNNPVVPVPPDIPPTPIWNNGSSNSTNSTTKQKSLEELLAEMAPTDWNASSNSYENTVVAIQNKKTDKVNTQNISNPTSLSVVKEKSEWDKFRDASKKLDNALEKIVAIIFDAKDMKKNQDLQNALDKLKSQMTVSITGKKVTVPDEVYQAFAEAIYRTTEASKVSEYKLDRAGYVNQIYGQVEGGLKSGLTESVTINGKRYLVEYTVFSFAGIGNGWADVSWGNNKATLTWTNANAKDGAKALSEYSAILAQLNSDAWTEFVSYCLTGTSKGKKALDLTNKIIMSICDKKYAENFINEIGGEFANKVKNGIFKNGFKEFIKNTMPNGESIVNVSELYVKAKKQLDVYESQINKYQNLDANQQVYESYQQAYQLLSNAIGSF